MTQPTRGNPPDGARLVAALRQLGIRQQGDPILRQTTRPFALPAEADEARRLHATLFDHIEHIKAIHAFSKGIGLAAPQIGIARALAVVQTPGGEQLAMINPTVIDQTDEHDTQYEGCLSFFDVRGQVSRPLGIHLAHTDLDGARRELNLEEGTARLVLHEVDHLHGRLYSDRMPPGARLVPLAEYRQSGTAWQY